MVQNKQTRYFLHAFLWFSISKLHWSWRRKLMNYCVKNYHALLLQRPWQWRGNSIMLKVKHSCIIWSSTRIALYNYMLIIIHTIAACVLFSWTWLCLKQWKVDIMFILKFKRKITKNKTIKNSSVLWILRIKLFFFC